tara:strand:- start:115 stop:858 length:744 start_codon:yes stop_codon:yes gene_type:complete
MKYSFITGLGRSGTKFLSYILRDDQTANVFHEYIGAREYWLSSWYIEPRHYSIPYLKMKKKEIDKSSMASHFIDVNAHLNNDIESLNIVFNNPKIFHLIRDPRRVISSIYLRINANTINKVPKDGYKIDTWLNEDKFYRICYNWKNTISYLLDCNLEIIKFEKIIDDYDYFKDKLLQPLNINISKKIWSVKRHHKINKTKSSLFRYLYSKVKNTEYASDKIDFNRLSETNKDIFNDLCLPLVKNLDY